MGRSCWVAVVRPRSVGREARIADVTVHIANAAASDDRAA